MEWVDTAKGLAIVLVVQFHSVLFLGRAGGTAPFWDHINVPFETLRMPLFFCTAGLFAGKALRLPFRRLMADRVAGPRWLYALWTFLFIVAFWLFPFDPRVPAVVESLRVVGTFLRPAE